MARDELEVAIAAPPTTPTSPAPRSPAGIGSGGGGGNNAALMTQLLADVSQWAAQAAVSLHHCRDLHQALSGVTGAAAGAGAGAVDQWAAADLDPLLARAQALVAQAVAWEDAAAPRLPPALAALTRQRWAGLIRRVTERVRQAHEAAGGKAAAGGGGGGVGALLLLGGGKEVEEPAAAAADVVVSGGLARLEVSSPPGGVGAVRLHKQQPTQQPQQQLQQQQPNVLETWKGWYVQDGLRFSVTATLFLTGTDRLCGYGSDALGDWTWEGEYVGTHQVVLRKQYVVGKATTTSVPSAHKVQYMGTRAVSPDGGKQVMEGFWLALPGPTATGTFALERQAESVATAHGHFWSGAWTTTTTNSTTSDAVVVPAVSPTYAWGSGGGTGPGAIITSPKYASSYFTAPAAAAEESQLWTADTELVFTAHNRLFGLGTDRAGKFTVTGNYVEDGGGAGAGAGGGVKVTGLKLYQPAEYHGQQPAQPAPQQSAVQFWGEIPAQAYSDLSRTRPVVMAGEWAGAADPAVQGTFHMQLEHLDVTTAGDDAGGGGWAAPAAAAAVPAACASTATTTTLGEVEWWEGWYNQFREQKQVAAQAFLMDGTRPCGVGLDSLGEWTWEGDFVDEDRLLLRKQYVNNPSYRIMYDGSRTTEAGDEVIRGRWGFAPAVDGAGGAAGDPYAAASAAAAFQPPHTQKFCLVKLPAASDAGLPLVLGCGQHWTGYREVMSGSSGLLGGGAPGGGGVVKPGADNLKAAAGASGGGRAGGYHRVLDGGALVVASNHRIFGFGSDVHGTFTYLGKFGRYREGRASVKLRMVKLYAPAPGPAGAGAPAEQQQPQPQPQPVQYRGQMDVRSVAAGSTVVQGSWATADGSSHGSFRWQAHHHLDLLDVLQAAAAADLHHLLQHAGSPSSSPYEVVVTK